MTSSGDDIGERDLLAYADGLLDQDPARKRAVELFLRGRPEEARRMRAYALQNEAIRTRFAGVLAEPVPERLSRLLDAERGRRPLRGAARIAASLALIAIGVVLGWAASESASQDEGVFVSRAVAGYRSGAASHAAALPPRENHLGWLSQQVAVNIDVPDLSALGLYPVSRSRLPTAEGHSTVRIEYGAPAGRRIVLVIGTRWQNRVPTIHLAREGGLRIAHWQDGPLSYGLVADSDAVPLEPVAEMIAERQERKIRAIGREPEVIRDVRSLGTPQPAALPAVEGNPAHDGETQGTGTRVN